MNDRWTVEFADAGTRLDLFLAGKSSELSRSQAKKKADAGSCFVNGKAVTAHYALKQGDVVEVKEAAVPAASTTIQEANTADASHAPLRIIHETANWIVVDKPTGVLMHPDHDATGSTLVDALIAHAPGMIKAGEDPSRPGIISRLDKEVSGLVVVAKTQQAFEHLKRQFAEHRVTKVYVALVHGEVPLDEGDLKFRIARSTSKARMAARPEGAEGGQAAWTHYAVMQRFTGATLLRLQIFSGRTHQIRAHLHAFGHPVIGDPLYTLKQTKRNIIAPRVMLQSVHLAFNDPATNEPVAFDLPLDPSFNDLMQRLGTSL